MQRYDGYNDRIEALNEELKDNLKTALQLVDGFEEIKTNGDKEDILFYSEMIIDTYRRIGELFLQINVYTYRKKSA